MSVEVCDVPTQPSQGLLEQDLDQPLAVDINTVDVTTSIQQVVSSAASLTSENQPELDEETQTVVIQRQPQRQRTESDDYDTDLEIETGAVKDYNATWSSVYLETCKELGVVPVSYFIRHMKDEILVMRHHGIGPLGAKALSIPLVTNTSVTNFDLEGNWLEAEGAVYLSEMLKENCYIAELSLANNCLGSQGQGAAAIGEMLQCNSSLRVLNLSGNNFQDKDARAFASAILENNQINQLDLSHNEFSDGAGELLGHAIGENESLEVLDLSWNHFRGQSALALVEGIKVSSRLKQVNMSWNGLGDEGALAVGECLTINSILLQLDVSSNRIGPDGVAAIAKRIDPNENLKVFKIGQNPIGPSGASLLLNAINNERSVLEELDLEDVTVDKEFKKLYENMRESRPLTIQHGGVLSDYVIVLPKRKKRDYAKPIRIFIKETGITVDEFMERANLSNDELYIDDVWACFDDVGIDISIDHVDRLATRLESKVDEKTVACGIFAPKLADLLNTEEPEEEEAEKSSAAAES